MIGNIHLKQAIKGLWVKTLVLGAGLFVFEMLFTLLATSSEVRITMLKKMKDMPPMVEKMFGKGFMEAVIQYGAITIGYFHPFMLVIFIVFIFFVVTQVVTGEISSGTIGFTLSKPVSRKRLVVNTAIIIYSGLGVLALFTYLSSYLGVKIFLGNQLSIDPFSTLAWNLYLIMVFIAGYIIIFAAISDTGKMLFTIGGIVLMVFYILSMAGPLWRPLEIFNPVNPFVYYNPFDLLAGARISLTKSLALIGASGIMFIAAGWIFNRRDIASG